MKRRFANASLGCLGLVVALVLLEIIIRVGGATDADGQFSFLGYTLEPHVLPINRLKEGIDAYLQNVDTATILFDARTGWAYRPNSLRHQGTFTVNSAGMRSQREFSKEPLPDTLRIAAFGDSFTAGDDVNDAQVWTNQLELNLIEQGIRAEVLNFGVGGYDMGQAFLRWRAIGQQFQPDIVIFGFQPENLDRNVNVFRILYIHGPSIPFSKPRFIISDGKLELINLPALPPERMVATFEAFSNHPLAAYEDYYRSRDVVSKWWLTSRLGAFIYEVTKAQEGASQADYGPTSERGMLGKAIVDAFAADVAERAADFFVVHLPLPQHMAHIHNGGQSPYRYLLDYLRETYRYIPFDESLGPEYMDESYWGPTGHYGAEVEALLGQTVARALSACIEERSCRPQRFDNPAQFAIDK
ncbi:MAG: SGNH/GDSL hydrolase family protein [Chloroflexota bacterium]|nr:SGNH/GDSL hydrolase family protein [Chloroflexota bacterium]